MSRARAYVDPDQKDPSKAVQRTEQSDEPVSNQGDDDGLSEQERRHSAWLDKDKAVQKRLGRLSKNLTRQFDQRLADREAEHQRERGDLLKRLEKLERGGSGADSADQAKHDAEMSELEAKQAAAFEAGDSALAAKIGRQMAAKEGAFIEAKTRAMLGERADPAKQQGQQQQDQGNAKYRPTATGRKFVRDQTWWEDPEFTAERSAANVIYTQMIDDGEDPNEPEFFTELSQRLVKKMPHMSEHIEGVELKGGKQRELDAEDFGDEPEEEAPQPRRRAPVQFNQDRGNNARRRNSVTLTDADHKVMRQVGLDPNNDKHVIHFAKSKRETAEAMRSSR